MYVRRYGFHEWRSTAAYITIKSSSRYVPSIHGHYVIAMERLYNGIYYRLRNVRAGGIIYILISACTLHARKVNVIVIELPLSNKKRRRLCRRLNCRVRNKKAIFPLFLIVINSFSHPNSIFLSCHKFLNYLHFFKYKFERCYNLV